MRCPLREDDISGSIPPRINIRGILETVMKFTNDSYTIFIGTKNFTERYYRDKKGWLKISARGKTFRMTAEHVLNHLLPALSGIKPNLIIKVEHKEKT